MRCIIVNVATQIGTGITAQILESPASVDHGSQNLSVSLSGDIIKAQSWYQSDFTFLCIRNSLIESSLSSLLKHNEELLCIPISMHRVCRR